MLGNEENSFSMTWIDLLFQNLKLGLIFECHGMELKQIQIRFYLEISNMSLKHLKTVSYFLVPKYTIKLLYVNDLYVLFHFSPAYIYIFMYLVSYNSHLLRWSYKISILRLTKNLWGFLEACNEKSIILKLYIVDLVHKDDYLTSPQVEISKNSRSTTYKFRCNFF